MAQCPAISNPNTTWPTFCPSIAAAYVFAVLFGLSLVTHIVQAILYRKWYSVVIITSAAMETGSFIIKVLSINNVTNKTLYSDWFILTLVAPVWVNAYAYMTMGRMVYNYIPTASVYKVKAWNLGTVFVLLDVCAFFIQLIGLAMVGAKSTPSGQLTGIHIYMVGIAFQQVCIFGFFALAIRFGKHLKEQPMSSERSKAFVMLHVEYAVVTLITIRIIFRLIEYSHGIGSGIALHEVYEYIFDSTVMWIAMVLFNVVHPGRIMPGKEMEWPGRKTRKAMKKQGRVPVAGGYQLAANKQTSVKSDVEQGGLME